jgi:hypothetical protein
VRRLSVWSLNWTVQGQGAETLTPVIWTGLCGAVMSKARTAASVKPLAWKRQSPADAARSESASPLARALCVMVSTKWSTSTALLVAVASVTLMTLLPTTSRPAGTVSSGLWRP